MSIVYTAIMKLCYITAMRKLLSLLLFIFFQFSVFGQTVDIMLKAALENDTETQLLQARYEKAVLDYIFSGRLDPVRFSVTTGKNGMGVQWNWSRPNETFGYFLAPAVSFYAGEAVGTEITVNVSYTASGTTVSEPAVDAAVSQSLNRILGLYHEKSWNELLSFYTVEKARIALLTRAVDVQIEVFQQLSALYTIKKDMLNTEAAFLQSESKYKEMVTYKYYQPDSPSYKLIEEEYLQKKKSRDNLSKKMERQKDIFSLRFGITLISFPETVLPEAYDTTEFIKDEKHTGDYLGTLKENVYREKVYQLEHEYPDFNLLFNYQRNQDTRQQTNSNISGGLSCNYKGLTLSVLTGIYLERALFFVSLVVSYSIPDFQKEEYTLNSAKKELEISSLEKKLDWQNAEILYKENEISYYDAVDSLQGLESSIEIRNLELKRASVSLRSGTISQTDFTRLENQRDALLMQKCAAQISVLLAVLRTQKILFSEEEKK